MSMRTSRKLRIKAYVIKHTPAFLQKRLNSFLYKRAIGRSLNWKNLNAYTEKMQWAKFYDRDQMKTLLSDKYLVREWVSKKIGKEFLIPLIGVWDKFSEIDFNSLPNQFVLKTNHGSGSVLIVKDKEKFDIANARKLFNDWMSIDYAYATGFELQYSNIKRKIIAEKYLETDLGELQDYKFLCFDGKPYYCWVDLGRFGKHTRNVYNLDWELQPWNQYTYGNSKDPIPKPKNFEKMVEIATSLCQGFSHVRVDLYNIDGVIYFGEMTFTNGCGFDKIIPDEYDYILGQLWNINTKD
ncbi:MAG: glycosyltransferase [Rikenellaceae bacterium]|nr:glycosyltransferase [Rikenellaceae bacterium]